MLPCPRCGNLLVNGQTICDVCGVDILKDNISAMPYYNESTDGRQGIRLKPRQAPPQVVVSSTQDTSENKKPMSKRKYNILMGILLSGCAFFVIGAIVGSLFLFGIIK